MTTSLNDLLIHQRTAKAIRAFLNKPAHALLITAPEGAGKATLAIAAASNLLGSEATTNPFFSHIKRAEGKQDIPIDAIRLLTRKTKLRTTGTANTRRVFFIENAHQMNQEAQNALLKLLEEPPLDSVIILTATSDRAMLPTIVSRAQKMVVLPVPLDQSFEFYHQYKQKDIEASWQLSRGAVGLLSALLKDESSHQLRRAVEDVKDFIKKPAYERLLILEKVAGDRLSLSLFLEALSRVLAPLSHVAIERNSKSASAIINSRKTVNALITALNDNTSPRLINLELVLNLKI